MIKQKQNAKKFATNRCLVNSGPLFSLLTLVTLVACDSSMENTPDNNEIKNSAYEEQILDLQSKVESLNQSTEYHSEGFQSYYLTQQRTQDYLSVLYKNVNEQRDPDLPSWQEMFRVLTDEAALSPEYTLGVEGLQTNFSRIHQKLLSNADLVVSNQGMISTNKQMLDEQQTQLESQEKTLAVINQNVSSINSDLSSLRVRVEKHVKDSNTEISLYKERLDALESELRIFMNDHKRELMLLKSQISSMNDQFNSNNLQDMSVAIEEHQKKVVEYAQRLGQLDSDSNIYKGNLTRLNADLGTLRQDVQSLNATASKFAVTISEIEPNFNIIQCLLPNEIILKNKPTAEECEVIIDSLENNP